MLPCHSTALVLDLLQVVAGAYFGQDQALKLQFREEEVHV